MNIGKGVRLALVMRDMKQRDLSAATGIAESKVSLVCNSQDASTKSLRVIAKALDMRVSELVALAEG
jgi:DNA-binding Xre family transcriptional regulator